MQENVKGLIIVGAGAAGLMSAIWAGRTNPNLKIELLDGARKLGVKILVAGGGRCNVTHDYVDETAYAGGSRNAIKKVLRRFSVDETITFFAGLGVHLKREETGKLFPVTDNARTVLDGLLRGLDDVNIKVMHPSRIERISHNGDMFTLTGEWGSVHASKVILATGGKSLPKSGSDGVGHLLAKSLGHSITRHVFPSLVPLTIPRDHFITSLSGIATHATLEVRTGNGKKLVNFTDSVLCTHFGLSGPCTLDVSRYYIDAKLNDPQAQLVVNWLPEKNAETVTADLLALGKVSVGRYLSGFLPERLARALCIEAGIEPSISGETLTRDARKALITMVTEMNVPVSGNRGFTYAEVTAGGVPLQEIRLETMESRICKGLYFAGEICDVDGRIGGYNFQWAWSSGYVAGISAAQA